MFAARFLTRCVLPAILVFAVAAPASAQLRPTQAPPKGKGTTWFASITFENKSDIAIVFEIQWDGQAKEKITLDSGKKITTRTSFQGGAKEPGLTATFDNGSRGKNSTVVQNLKAGFDTKKDNVGRVYDFQKKASNVGDIIDLKPR